MGAGNDTLFCSELVAEAFAGAGLQLTSEPSHRVTPGDILNLVGSGSLEYVGHLKTGVQDTPHRFIVQLLIRTQHL